MWDIAIFIINKIKEAIESVKTSLEEVKTNTARNTTASASGTLSQKLTHIIELLTVGSVKDKLETIATQTTVGNVSVVKSIQRGLVAHTTPTTTVEINEVNPDKCVVILTGTGYSASSPYVISIDATNFVLKSPINDYCLTIDWQVIEFY